MFEWSSQIFVTGMEVLQELQFWSECLSSPGISDRMKGILVYRDRTWNFFLLDSQTSRPKILLVHQDFMCPKTSDKNFNKCQTEFLTLGAYSYAHS